VLDPGVMLPQVAQGALAAECRVDDTPHAGAIARHRRSRRAPRRRCRARVPRRARRRVRSSVWRARPRQCRPLDRDRSAARLTAGGRLFAATSCCGPGSAATIRRRRNYRRARSTRREGRPGVVRRGRVTVYLVGRRTRRSRPADAARRGTAARRRRRHLRPARIAPSSSTWRARAPELVDVGKAPGNAPMNQDQINAALVDRGRAGLEVVRLKGGRSLRLRTRRRGGRGVSRRRRAVRGGPGITSAIAAAAYAGIPVTPGACRTSLTCCHRSRGPEPRVAADTNWDALAARAERSSF